MNRKEFLALSAAGSVPLLFPSATASAMKLSETAQAHTSSLVTPSFEVFALNRLGYGCTEKDLAIFQERGLENWLKWQLTPLESEDTEVHKKIKAARFEYTYDDKNGKKVHEFRKLTHLDKSPEEIWSHYHEVKDKSFFEWVWPTMEVVASNWIRMVYSKWQLREVMTEFWRDHFNVTMNGNIPIGTVIPSFERDVLRKHCFGNFKEFLVDVAKSPAMLYYLNNNVSKASPANENYARELFELHTLGEEHYLNHLYDQWRDVPGALEGAPVGYIDEDVYEAARAFTGWTVGDGSPFWRSSEKEFLPDTGVFHYHEPWHDNYQKRVLGTEFRSNEPPMADGVKVLDLVARHPGTAKHLCTKLCKKLVSDAPSQALVERVTEVWMANQDASDQLSQVIQTIILSDDFKDAFGQKVKKPHEIVASFMRSTNTDFSPNQMLHWVTTGMGYKMYTWPAPTGHPEDAVFWTGAGMMVSRWKSIHSMLWWKEFGIGTPDLIKETPQDLRMYEIVDFWSKRLLGQPLPEPQRKEIIALFCGDMNPNNIPGKSLKSIEYRVINLVAVLGMSPQFQMK